MPVADDTIATEETLRVYEFCVLYPGNLSQKEEGDLLREVEKTIEETGARQVAKDMWGKRGLAYPIGGHEEGCFVVYHYEVNPAELKEMTRIIGIIPNVLRHIMVKPPRGYQIVKYSETFGQWLKERESEADRKEREREAKLQKRVAEKAKRQVRRTEEKREAAAEVPEEKKPADTKKITEELERILSEDEFEI